MTILVLIPNGDVAGNGWTPSSGADHFACVDEYPTPDDADYLLGFPDSITDQFYISNHTSESGTINSVRIYARCKNIISGNGTASSIILSVPSGYSTQYNLTTSWTLYHSDIFSVNPVTGLAWTWGNIDSVVAVLTGSGMYIDNKNKSVPWCSQLYVEVDYTSAAIIIPFVNYYPKILAH